jgi:hypothetical protein
VPREQGTKLLQRRRPAAHRCAAPVGNKGARDRFWFGFDHETIVRRKGLIIGKPGDTGTGDFGTGNEGLAEAAWFILAAGG